MSGPQPLGELLSELVRGRGWEEPLRGAELAARWEEVVGPELAARCRPVRLAAKRLVVRTSSPAWAVQVRYLAHELQARIAELFGPGLVDAVEVEVGEVGDR